MTIIKAFSWNESNRIPIRFSLKFVPRSPINNIPALVLKMAWPLATSHCLNQWWSDYWRIYASVGLNELNGIRQDIFPDSKVHGANMGPTWVLSAPDGPHVGPMNFAIRVVLIFHTTETACEIIEWLHHDPATLFCYPNWLCNTRDPLWHIRLVNCKNCPSYELHELSGEIQI